MSVDQTPYQPHEMQPPFIPLRPDLSPWSDAERDAIVEFGNQMVRSAMATREILANVPEGCTPADAKVLREANHALAQEVAERDALRAELATMEARKDAAYLERNQVVAALAKAFPSGVARTAIEGWSDDWHGCVYIDLPTGQASWHFHDSQAYLFDSLPLYAGQWDGHDTPEKYRRLAALAAPMPQPAPPTVTLSMVEMLERSADMVDETRKRLNAVKARLTQPAPAQPQAESDPTAQPVQAIPMVTDAQVCEAYDALPRVGEAETVHCVVSAGTLRALVALAQAVPVAAPVSAEDAITPAMVIAAGAALYGDSYGEIEATDEEIRSMLRAALAAKGAQP